MIFRLLLKGLLIGFSIAAPVGPIGVLCIRRTLAEGRVAGLACGLGAATADAIDGCVAAFGLTLISRVLVAQQRWLGLLGGLFLCVLALRTFRAKPKDAGVLASEGTASPASDRTVSLASDSTTSLSGAQTTRLLGAYGSTFLLTLTNPMTILSFAAIFAGLGLGTSGGSGRPGAALALVAGVFVGSALWWLILSGAAAALRTRFTPRGLRWVNQISGCIIAVFGLLALWRGATVSAR